MIRSSIIENAYFSSSHDGDIKKVLKEIKSDSEINDNGGDGLPDFIKG